MLPKKKKIKHIIESHSWDYDTYLKLKDKKIRKKNYAVFIDCDVAFHPDYIFHKMKSPVKPEYYFDSLNKFFDRVEKNLISK